MVRHICFVCWADVSRYFFSYFLSSHWYANTSDIEIHIQLYIYGICGVCGNGQTNYNALPIIYMNGMASDCNAKLKQYHIKYFYNVLCQWRNSSNESYPMLSSFWCFWIFLNTRNTVTGYFLSRNRWLRLRHQVELLVIHRTKIKFHKCCGYQPMWLFV